MRPFASALSLLAALVVASSAAAAPQPPENGYLVFKDHRSYAVVEVRDKATGRVVAAAKSSGEKRATADACRDSRHKFAGPRWRRFEPYLVNISSTPAHLEPAETLADVIASHEAWETPFTTDCRQPNGRSSYRAAFGGTTSLSASLVASLVSDGANVVSFESLVGTICDGPGVLACVVIDYKGGRIVEADLALERDLTRYGFEDYWTTDDTTWADQLGGRFAISDTATHEFGHFAGLDHVEKSPALTMFPAIHDGAQTLGLGDMKGALARY